MDVRTAADKTIRHLVDQCGYAVAYASATLVRFEKARVFVTLSVDEHAREAALEIGRIGENWSFTLEEAAACLDSPKVASRAKVRGDSELVTFVQALWPIARDFLCTLSDISDEAFDTLKRNQAEVVKKGLEAARLKGQRTGALRAARRRCERSDS